MHWWSRWTKHKRYSRLTDSLNHFWRYFSYKLGTAILDNLNLDLRYTKDQFLEQVRKLAVSNISMSAMPAADRAMAVGATAEGTAPADGGGVGADSGGDGQGKGQTAVLRRAVPQTTLPATPEQPAEKSKPLAKAPQ